MSLTLARNVIGQIFPSISANHQGFENRMVLVVRTEQEPLYWPIPLLPPCNILMSSLRNQNEGTVSLNSMHVAQTGACLLTPKRLHIWQVPIHQGYKC